MYFTNRQHQDNFMLLLYKNRSRKSDKQYLVNYYVAAVPEIFDLLDLSDNETILNPLYFLMEWDDEEKCHIPSAPGLTGTTRYLLEIGLSLFNGHKCDLDYSLSEDFAQVVIQACKIRYGLTDPLSGGIAQ